MFDVIWLLLEPSDSQRGTFNVDWLSVVKPDFKDLFGLPIVVLGFHQRLQEQDFLVVFGGVVLDGGISLFWEARRPFEVVMASFQLFQTLVFSYDKVLAHR